MSKDIILRRSSEPAWSTMQSRDQIPELAHKSCELTLRKDPEKGSDVLSVRSGGGPPRQFDVAKQDVGVSGSSTYVFFRDTGIVENGSRVFEVVPSDSWLALRPSITHQTLSIEDAERALEQQDYDGGEAEKRIGRLRRRGGDDGEEGGEAARAAPSFGTGDEFGDAMEEDANFIGGPAADEDGREGLDMEGDEFDDDDDDFEEEDDQAMDARLDAKKRNDNAAARLRLHAAEEDGEEAAELPDVRDPKTLGGGESEWSRAQKGMLKKERQRRREEESSNDGEDGDTDDSDDDGGGALLRSVLQSDPRDRRRAAAAAQEAGEEDAAMGDAEEVQAGTKRKAPAAAALPVGDESKRVKHEAGSRGVAPPSNAVQARDVVLLLHQRGQMPLKELISKFKPLLQSQADTQRFMEIVLNVGKIVKTDAGKLIDLKESARFDYQL